MLPQYSRRLRISFDFLFWKSLFYEPLTLIDTGLKEIRGLGLCTENNQCAVTMCKIPLAVLVLPQLLKAKKLVHTSVWNTVLHSMLFFPQPPSSHPCTFIFSSSYIKVKEKKLIVVIYFNLKFIKYHFFNI